MILVTGSNSITFLEDDVQSKKDHMDMINKIIDDIKNNQENR
jgi:hypothetical protein